MSFLVYDLKQNEITYRYNDRQDAERVAECLNTIEEINRRVSNEINSVFERRYIVINYSNQPPASNRFNFITASDIAGNQLHIPTINFCNSSHIGNNAYIN